MPPAPPRQLQQCHRPPLTCASTATMDTIIGGKLGVQRSRIGAATTSPVGVRPPSHHLPSHLIAMLVTQIGGRAGPNRRRLGAAEISDAAARAMTAKAILRPGQQTGRPRRRFGAALTPGWDAHSQSQSHTIVMQDIQIGNRDGRTASRIGAAGIMDVDAMKMKTTTVKLVTPTGKKAGQMERRSGAASIITWPVLFLQA